VYASFPVLLLALLSAEPAADASKVDPQTGLPVATSRPEPVRSPTPGVSSPSSSPSTRSPTTSPTTTTTSPIAPPTRGVRRPPEARPVGDLDGIDPSTIDSPELEYETEAPFAVEALALSDVLKVALETNIDLANSAYDIAISEANIMAAVGAYDLFLKAGINGSVQKTPQRGSAFVFSTGSRSVGANVGFQRKLETGGTLTFDVNVSRALRDQPRSFFNAAAGSTTLGTYTIAPTLTLNQPLLKGAGIRVNRADIDRAKIAKNQTEAVRMVTAQNVVRDIILAYWEVLYAQRDLQNKRRSASLAAEQLDRTKAEIAAGRRSPLDGRSLEQTLALRESDVLLAENALLERSLNLRTLLGQDIVDRDVLGVEAATDPQVLDTKKIDVRAEIRQALEANPQIRQLQLSLASRRIDELVAANQRLPQLDIQGSFAPQGRSIDFIGSDAQGTSSKKASWGDAFGNFISDDIGSNGIFADMAVSGSINLTWDVQNRTPKANHQRAILELHKAQNDLKVTQRTISTSVIRSSNTLRTAAKRMEVNAFSVELAEENLKAEKARYAVGRSTSYDVLFRMDELAIAEANLLRSQIDYLQALTELQTLTGELLPSYGIELVAGNGSTPGKK
jgi:outer membrane protein TolC